MLCMLEPRSRTTTGWRMEWNRVPQSIIATAALPAGSVTDIASFRIHWTLRDKAVRFLRQAGLPEDFRYFALFPQAVSESGAYIDRPSDSKLLGELANASAEALRALQGGAVSDIVSEPGAASN